MHLVGNYVYEFLLPYATHKYVRNKSVCIYMYICMYIMFYHYNYNFNCKRRSKRINSIAEHFQQTNSNAIVNCVIVFVNGGPGQYNFDFKSLSFLSIYMCVYMI